MAAKSKEEVLCTYLHVYEVLHKSVRLVSEHAGGDDGVDDDAQDEGAEESRAGRITAKNIWGLIGSATCAEALAILQFKDSERKRKAQEKAAKDEERELKRRRNVVDAITKALSLIEKVVKGGPSVVKSFRVTELKALLPRDESQGGTDVKGNKAELLERAMALASVKLEVATYFDSSARSQAQPVTQTPTPALPAPSGLPGILSAALESTTAPISGLLALGCGSNITDGF
jgi:hypothetical protein